MNFFLRNLFLKFKLRIFSVSNVQTTLKFITNRIVGIFDSSENVIKALVHFKKVALKKPKWGQKAQLPAEIRISSLAVPKTTTSARERIKRAARWQLKADAVPLPRLQQFDVQYLKTSTTSTSRLPVVFDTLSHVSNVQSRVVTRRISRSFKIMFCIVMGVMLLILLILIPTITRSIKHYPTLNGDDFKKTLISAGGKYLTSSPNAIPPQFGNTGNRDNLWSVYSASLISYTVLKQSNTYNFNWIVRYKFYFSTNNSSSMAIQSAYILHATVNARLVVIGNAIVPLISIYKPWTIDYHYFFVPSFLGSRFYKTTNFFRYDGDSHWDPINKKFKYGTQAYYFSNYSVSFQFRMYTIDQSTFESELSVLNWHLPIITNNDIDYENYFVGFPRQLALQNTIIGAFRGPLEADMDLSFEIDVTYEDFRLVAIQKPTISSGTSAGTVLTRRSNGELANRQIYHRATTTKWTDKTPKFYQYKIPNVNDVFSPLYTPDAYLKIHSIAFLSRMRTHNNYDNGKKQIYQLPSHDNHFWPIYVHRIKIKFEDVNYTHILYSFGQQFVNNE